MTASKAVLIAACTLAIGIVSYSCGLQDGKARARKVESPPAAVQWMGRLVAGDGAKAVYQVSQIDIGMRADGVLVWRMKAPEPAPFPLESLKTNK